MAATISFHSDYIMVSAHSSIIAIDLGFPGAETLQNDHKTPKPVTGNSTQAIVTYKDGNTVKFLVNNAADFPTGETVTITGGGGDDNTLKAADDSGNKTGTWKTQ